MRINSSKWLYLFVSVLAVLAFGAVFLPAALRRKRAEPVMSPPETIEPKALDPWKQAALKAEAERGEPMGRKAEVETPAQLRHYSERGRFLAVQAAESREQRLRTPHDSAELITLVREGEFVEVPPLGAGFILYGVGWGADDGPFTHYEEPGGQRVTLYGGDEELRREYERIDETLKVLEGELAELGKETSATPARERERRAELRKQTVEKVKAKAELKKEKSLLDSFYKREKRRRMLVSEYESVAGLARDFGGRNYDLSDAVSRKNLKIRLLSFLRPAALALLEEVARAYEQKFERPLPITSLVRTDEYQAQLGETNPNATQNDVPPHTTGLAFDIYYGYMAAPEQEFVMALLARLKDEGRIEVLRENRDHYHVFAFADGRPPDETLVRKALGTAGKGNDKDASAEAVSSKTQGKKKAEDKQKQRAAPDRRRRK
ncbi:MAG: DUF5715 family protein [Acidobacteria bacterium]|nr:DUF5715 family protein [Acidobacteriota bacterium]